MYTHTYGSVSAGRGKWAKFGIFCEKNEALLWLSGLIFQVCSTVLKRLCPLKSKNTFVLVLAILVLDFWKFCRFLPQNLIFWNFWGKNQALIWLNFHSWTWFHVPIIVCVKSEDFPFFGSFIAHLEPALQMFEVRLLFVKISANKYWPNFKPL